MSRGSHPRVLGLQQAFAFATRHFAIVCLLLLLLLHPLFLRNTPQLHKLSSGPYFQTAPPFQTDIACTKNARPCATQPNSINCPGRSAISGRDKIWWIWLGGVR